MSLKLVIFDWDGTVMDSVAKIVSSMQHAAQRENLVVPSEQAVKDIIGLSLAPALAQLFGDLTTEQANDMVDFYKEEYLVLDAAPSPLFDGITDVFSSLAKRNIKMAVATGKSRAGLDRLLAQTGLTHYFCDTMTADEAQSKPHPQMIEDIISRQDVHVDEVIMIGDSSLDLTMANNAGVKSIGVSYGAHDGAKLKTLNPLAVVDNASALLDYL
jgi:phosphoglycolate phosphatase